MSNYIRVIPRDLFNEASLLKCLGHLYIALENTRDHKAKYDVEDLDHFDIVQSSDDGSIFVYNLPFSIAGRRYHLSRPHNSRQPWPLWMSELDNPNDDPIEVFTEDGKLSPEFLAKITQPVEA